MNHFFNIFTSSCFALWSHKAKELEEKVDLKGRMAAPPQTPQPTALFAR